MWVESPHRERQQSAKSWGYGGKAPVAADGPTHSSHDPAGSFRFSFATRRERAAPKAASTFGSGAPSYNALKAHYLHALTRLRSGVRISSCLPFLFSSAYHPSSTRPEFTICCNLLLRRDTYLNPLPYPHPGQVPRSSTCSRYKFDAGLNELG